MNKATLSSDVKIGMNVRTRDDKNVGRVTALHDDTFEIEKGLFFLRDYSASFTEISLVDAHGVMLGLTASELEAARQPGQVGTSLTDRAAGVVDHTRAAIEAAVNAGHHPK